MPIMLVLLAVTSLLLLVLFVLLLTLYLSKTKRLRSSRTRSRPGKIRSEASSNGSSLCQTCHMCGGLRLRSPNVAIFDDQSRSPSHFTASDRVPRVRSKAPREHWTAMKTQILLSIKQVVQKLLSCQKKQTQGELLRRLVSLSNFSWQKAISESKPMCEVPVSLPAVECSTASTAESCLNSHSDGIVSNDFSNPVTSEFSASNVGTNLGISSSQENSNLAILEAEGTKGTTDTDIKGAPVHRLVLEILVSPSGNTDGRPQGSCPPSAAGLMLKLETNAMLEHLAGCSEALKSKDKKCEHSVNVPQVTCLSRDRLSKDSGVLCTFEDQASQILDEVVLVPDAGARCSAKLKSVLDSTSTSTDILDGSQMAGLKDRGQSCHSLCRNVRGDCIKGTASYDATAKNSNVTGQLKFRTGNHVCKNAVSDMASKSTFNVKEDMLGPEACSVVPLGGLGSLRITLLKSDVQEEGTEKASQAGSPLASLNVSGKPSGGSGLTNPKKEKWTSKSETSCSSSPKSTGRMEQGILSVCETNLVEREDHASMQASTVAPLNDSFASSFKKEKKKKKSKGKKLKTKTGALADAQEMQEIGKIALEATKHVSAVPEREIGCVCGASKGELHTETCPYPFTSSGSMLQRKIKEQYNHLVKSNVAKTLTLAQVGQFTSCLVEAKATLQQKSESIQRKFTITKSLLSKADKSSFDRLCGQIYGLEMEQKKLEEDTVVYNRLQEQLKLSPAYKKMLEYGRAHFELQPHTGQMIEKLEPDDSELSFEELLAQEKKDAFWQRHSLARSAVSAS